MLNKPVLQQSKRNLWIKLKGILILLLVFSCVLCQAQQNANKKNKKIDKAAKVALNTDSINKAKSDSLQKAKIKPLKVLNVYSQKHGKRADDYLDSASIGDIIVIEVANLDSLLRRSRCKDNLGNAYANCEPRKIRLFINGRVINGIEPISGAPDREAGKLEYRLDRNTENDRIWADILGAPTLEQGLFTKPVKVSVGLENEYAIETKTNEANFNIIRIHRGWFWICFFGLAVYLFLLIILIKKRGLLRDRGIDLSPVGITDNGQPRTYSLGRFQMAFWFTLVIASFLFIWLITDAYDIITPNVLALIGISAGTALSASVIDNSKSEELLQKVMASKAEKISLEKEIIGLDARINTNPPPDNLRELQDQRAIKKARQEQLQLEIDNNANILKPETSKGFLNDILRDASGISFHRLQMFVWTLILGLLFVYTVWKRLSMPEFSMTLLALQGLTTVTYLGFKFPEK